MVVASRPNRAVFLDRDGTLGGDRGFVHPADFTLYKESYEAIKLLNDAGMKVVVITNQGRVAKGEISESQVESSFRRLDGELADRGAHMDGWYVCQHAVTEGCVCHKPSTLPSEEGR